MQSGRPATSWARFGFFTVLVATVPAVALRVPLHFADFMSRWRPVENLWPALGAFILTFSLGRSLRAIQQFVIARALTGSGASLRLRSDPVSISIASDDASKAGANALYVVASFAALLTLTSPALLGVHLGRLGVSPGVTALLPFFTIVLLLADLSPFRSSALTECLRALFIFIDRSGERELSAERAVRSVHILCCVAWVTAFGFFLAFLLHPFFDFVRSAVDLSSPSAVIATVLLTLAMFGIVISCFDDIVNGIGDGGGGDVFSIRRLWSRKRMKTGAGVTETEQPSRTDLENLPLLRQMDPTSRGNILKNSSVIAVRDGHAICRQGARDRTLYILLDGRLKIVKRSTAGRSHVAAFLEPGSVVGEVAFFFGDRRTADVVATEHSRLLAIRHDPHLADLDRGRSDELKLRIWFLQALVTSPLFRDLPADAMDALVFAGQKREFKPGEKVITEGESGDSCYFIVQGQARVTQNFQPINVLKAGEAFGEIALLQPELLRTASVTAATDLLVVKVDGERFWNLLCEHLPLAVQFEKLAEYRLASDATRGQ